MKTVIPEKRLVTCDRCQQPFSLVLSDRSRAIKDTHIYISQHGLDAVGDPVCRDNKEYDLCDFCAHIVLKALSDAMKFGAHP